MHEGGNPDHFNKLLNKFKLPIALSLVGLVLIIGGFISSGIKPQNSGFPKESIVDSNKSISVDISGAVVKPGVYKLALNSRVEDSIKIAGGFSKDANAEYISKYLNMAQRLSDGMKIYIPFEGEQGVVSGVKSAGIVGVAGQVSVNSASQSELEALPGIGPVTASKIISGRPYGKPDDLLNQKIVSKATWEKIKDSIIY